MSKPIPPVSKYMTTSPHTIGDDQPLARAHEVMRKYHVRHLPVLHGAKLVGMITDRDVHLVEALRDVNPETTIVDDAMSGDPYSIDPDTPLDEVAAAMAENKFGSAVVVQNGKVVGVLTTVDICRALHDLLHSRLAKV